MRTLLSIFFIFVLSLLTFPKEVSAIYDPSLVPNNRFGIHILDVSELEDAARLVNSEGGDWGYVTIVVGQNQRDPKFWQGFLNKARKLHVIPIFRIATRPVGENWEKPSFGDIDGWVEFLSSLNWVMKNRYVVIGNEPNHAKEWGGELNPEEYAQYASLFAEKLKTRSDDFFVMLAGFDSSAPNSKETLDEAVFIRRMLKVKPDLFENIDGWASHSYPNPDFSGSENASGRGTVRGYKWELDLLNGFGIVKDLPVFITETGWVHNAGEEKSKNLKPLEISPRFKSAFTTAWAQKEVVAVTPFVFSYKEPPFDIFSWKDKEGNFYPFYNDVLALEKTRGEPIQEEKGTIVSLYVPPYFVTDSSFWGIALVRNEGQSIWTKDDIKLLRDDSEFLEIKGVAFGSLEPGHLGFVTFGGKTQSISGTATHNLTLVGKKGAISAPLSYSVTTISPVRMKVDSIFDKILKLLGKSGR